MRPQAARHLEKDSFVAMVTSSLQNQTEAYSIDLLVLANH